jgi:hypothetical protein
MTLAVRSNLICYASTNFNEQIMEPDDASGCMKGNATPTFTYVAVETVV